MENQIGVFRGRKTIQRSGSVGGSRAVFVKLQQNGNQLIYPTFGGFIKNPFRGSAKFFAGDLMWYKTDENGVHPEVYILKTYEVVSASGTTLNILNDGYKHKPFVGDKLGVAPEKIGGEMTAQTVVAVANATVDGKKVWAVTFGSAINAEEGDVLVEAGEDNTMLVKAINAVSPTDNDMLDAPATDDEDFDNARYSFTPALGGLMYTNKMSPLPACVKALNKSDVNGWFKVDGLAAAPEGAMAEVDALNAEVDALNAEVDALNAEVELLNQNGATAPTTSTKGVVGSTYIVTASGSEALYVCAAVSSDETPTYTWIKMFPND